MDVTELAVNCSLALGDTAPSRRPRYARELGYTAVEFWWPFAAQSPNARERRSFVDDVANADVEVVLLNFPGGGPAVEDRGLLCVPGHEDDFVRAAETALSIGGPLGVTRYNPMSGNTAEAWTSDSSAFETAVRNLVRITPMIEDAGAEIVLEPLSGFPTAALKTYAHARELANAARAAGAAPVGILFDLYHAASVGDPVLQELAQGTWNDAALVGHVQIAEATGRVWPQADASRLPAWIAALRHAGYRGRIGLECTGEPVAASEIAARLATGTVA